MATTNFHKHTPEIVVGEHLTASCGLALAVLIIDGTGSLEGRVTAAAADAAAAARNFARESSNIDSTVCVYVFF